MKSPDATIQEQIGAFLALDKFTEFSNPTDRAIANIGEIYRS
jgi:hypothetical protein